MLARLVRTAIAAVLLAVSPVMPGLAVQPDEMLKDPALEQRARGLSSGLRCMVCQNESIDESHAPLARDIRVLVRERLVAGDTDQQVLDFLVARYGNFILLKPPVGTSTLLLWGAPFAVLVLGGIGAVIALRRKRAGREAIALTAEEEARIARLLDSPPKA